MLGSGTSYHAGLSAKNYLEELLNTDFRTMYYNLTQENRRAFWHSIIREIHLNTDHTVDSVDFL